MSIEKPLGLHAIINVKNIEDTNKLKFVAGVKPLFEKINEALQLNVLDASTHQFSPYGCSILYLLSESHFTGHTFVDEGAICMDIFTCNKETDFMKALDIIKTFFDVKNEDIQVDILCR